MSGLEIERKFLVRGERYREQATSKSRIRQGYIMSRNGRTVRVRVRDAHGYLTIKGPSLNGTLIEFVETFKIPIAKKFGLYLNLANKDDYKPLGILKLLRFAKVKRESIK